MPVATLNLFFVKTSTASCQKEKQLQALITSLVVHTEFRKKREKLIGELNLYLI